MDNLYRIRALSSGNGWWMAYKEGDQVHFWPVLSFAAIPDPEKPDHDIIVGQTSAVVVEGAEYEVGSNFAGYFHDSDFESIGKKLNAKAQDRLHSGGF